MSKQESKNRKTQITVAIIGAIGLIIATLITVYFSSEDSPIKNDSVIDNTEIEENEGTINKTNVGNNSGTVINEQTNNNYKIVNDKNEGYSVKGSAQLLLYLRKNKKFDINQNSYHSIEVTFTGDIVEISEGSDIVQYNSGYVKLMINGINCHTFNEMSLGQIRPRSKNIMLEELKKRIDQFVKKNPVKFQNKILECI